VAEAFTMVSVKATVLVSAPTPGTTPVTDAIIFPEDAAMVRGSADLISWTALSTAPTPAEDKSITRAIPSAIATAVTIHSFAKKPKYTTKINRRVEQAMLILHA